MASVSMNTVLVDPPRIEYLRVQNYRALKDIELKDLKPLTVLVGPNGSGKSTLFDVFAFLAESFQSGLRRAWDKRGRFKELRTRGEQGNLIFDVKYRERRAEPLITYHLEIGEDAKGPFVSRESLSWRRASHGRPFKFLDFGRETPGMGEVITGDMPDEEDTRSEEGLRGKERRITCSLYHVLSVILSQSNTLCHKAIRYKGHPTEQSIGTPCFFPAPPFVPKHTI